MPISRRFFQFFAPANILLGMLVAGSAHGAIPQAEYDALILATRGGATAPAIAQLRAWHAAYPEDRRIVYDLVAILDRAGDYEAALQYRKETLAGEAPAYAIKAIAHAARLAGRLAEAELDYQLLARKTPDDSDVHAGLVYVWMAQGRLQEALDYALARLPQLPAAYRRSDVPLMIALAELYERRGDWPAAANAYQEVLRFEPGFRFALRGRVFALSRAGLPFLAKRLGDMHPNAFTADEHSRLAQDVVAYMIRYGQAQTAADDGQKRFAAIEAALAANEAVIRDAGAAPAARFDRIVALPLRGRMRDAVDLYETMRKEQVAMPAYVQFAVADAYMHLQQPVTARDLYLDGLRQIEATDSPEKLKAQIALVFAYNEAEQHEEAEKLSEHLLNATNKKMYRGLPGLETANPDYTRVYLLNALLSLYNDRLAQAEKRLAELRALAPFNSDVRAAWASLQAARERPRAALEEYSLLLVDQPKSLDAAVGQAEMRLSLNELASAKEVLPRLVEDYPENSGVRNLVRRIEHYESPYFSVSANVGRGAAALGAESLYDAALYSSPLAASLGERFRLFSHVTRANGANRQNGESRTRYAVGADYRERDFSAEAAVTASNGTRNTNGAMVRLNRSFSDAWRAGVSVDTDVVDLPAAALRDGVRGELLKFDLLWSRDESRQAGVDLQRLGYSDGNIRNTAAIWWQERWLAAPTYKLDSVLALSTTHNSAGDRPYFNPDRDLDLSLRLAGEWLGWRNYQRWFKQRVVMGIGQYRQTGYGSAATADFRYEHEWSRSDALGLQYGVGRSFHPYDGKREYRSYLYVTLFGRFK